MKNSLYLPILRRELFLFRYSNMNMQQLRDILTDNNLKITPQRMAVMQAVIRLKDHPTVDNVLEFLKKDHPNIAIGTVYKILETLVAKGIIRKVKTDKDIMRYDAITERHHHLYCNESERIEDYYDEDLNGIIEEHFTKKGIPGFEIKDIRLQIIGKFTKPGKIC
ncbi:MAG: transcriptional repressor [Bacteroidales bacterium]|nr:MAG: transcriptional repressor [Bacteroidales bacterium]